MCCCVLPHTLRRLRCVGFSLLVLHLLVHSALPSLAAPAAAEGPEAVSAAAEDTASAPDPLRWFRPERRAAQERLEQFLLEAPSPEKLRRFHDALSSAPHVAGTPGDRKVIEWLAAEMAAMGLEVERQELWLYLPRPVKAEVEITAPAPISLPVQEAVLPEDPYSGHPDLTFGWNAYSASGEVEAGVVYANYGTKGDFEQLAELGVEVEGKIVLARYGRNFRGYKAKFAQEAGAVGLLMYLDPERNGYVRGRMWPVGGYAHPSSIQRGSILTLPYPGDPLTPFVPAVEAAERLDPEAVAFPQIPVQPVGWEAAQQILSRLQGPPVPEAWQGALPFNYRLGAAAQEEDTAGADPGVRVRLAVEQDRGLARTENVVGVLPGATHPEEWLIVGCHHDAWSFGAGDPNAGTIVVLETARAFARAAEQGMRPARTLVFAHWAAEEQGILGSVEWVEAHREELAGKAVAYLNLDMAAMGTELGGSASPTLETVLAEATRGIPKARQPEVTVYDDWTRRAGRRAATELPVMGSLGGGSDHVGFYAHLGIPSAGVSAWGSPGVSYHTNYEDLAWYRQVVGEDYEPAVMMTRVAGRVLGRLANADVLPLDPALYGPETVRHVETLGERARERGVEVDLSALEARARSFAEHAAALRDRALAALAAGRLAGEELAAVNRALLTLERRWLHEPGLPERPWYRNLFGAPDADAGYSAWMLPAVRQAIEKGDAAAARRWAGVVLEVFDRLEADLEAGYRPLRERDTEVSR